MSYPIARLNTARVGHPALLLASLLLLPMGCAVDDPTDPGGGGDDLTDPAGRLVLQPSDLCSDNPDTAIATFADANLEAVIRAALAVDAQQDLTCSLISELGGLDARFAGIESLVGIQNLTSLTGFLLSEPSIIDLSPLSGLTGLTFLALGDVINDISPLSGLTSLTELHLGFNSITDISALSGLTSLTTLYLQGNLALTDIGAVSGLTSLEYLDLRDSSITDISALSGLTDLTNLQLGNNSISDISALSGLTSLPNLNLELNSISDISALSGLTSLTTLQLAGNSITDISALSGLTSLLGLLAANNSISDISALSGLTSLGTLRLGGNSITDISELSGLTSLRELLLDNNSITVISALSGLRRLRDIGLSNNSGLSNIQPLLDNIGLGAGDEVLLTSTNVNCADVAALEAKGVTVTSDCVETNPVPTLTSISPDNTAAGGAEFTLTVDGTNFVASSVVRWDGADRTTTLVSSTQLTATIPASDIASVRTAAVTVFNPAPDGGETASLSFDVTVSFVSVATGGYHACGVTARGDAYCWGRGIALGSGSETTSVPTLVSGGLSFSSVSAGEQHTCGVTTAGALHCWGRNFQGQLGDGTSTNRSVPVPVLGPPGVTYTSVSAGQEYTCAVATTTGDAYCWGSNQDGQLGDGTQVGKLTPTLVVGGHTFGSVNAGAWHTCGVTTGNVAYCWGRNSLGQIGDGTSSLSDRTTPTLVVGGHAFSSVSAGDNLMTCGVTTTDVAYCWGLGSLGTGSPSLETTPSLVLGGLAFASVSTGSIHNCGVTTTNTAHCWGSNGDGALGDGTLVTRSSPVAVTGGLLFGSLSTGGDPLGANGFSCGRTTGGVLYCWGAGAEGQLGDGSDGLSYHRTSPVKVLLQQ